MVILRCTRELLARVSRPAGEPAATSSTRLGDWYVALVRVGRRQLLLAISERTRLPVVVPARDAKAMAGTLADAVRRVLLGLGAPEPDVAAECAAMQDAVFAPTRSRSLLGTINDFTFATQHRLAREPGTPLDELAIWLAQTPIHTRFHAGSPVDVTRELFGLEKARRPEPPPVPAAPPPAPTERPPAKRAQRRGAGADPMPMDFALFADVSTVQRCEYLDGAMHGSPSPSPAHQHAVLRVARALENYFAMRDREALVLVGPVTVFLGEQTVAQPDVLVVKRRQLSPRGVEGPPQLIVEVVTAESADRDRGVKLRVYGEAGVERYWLIDMDRQAVECLGPRRLPGMPGASIAANVLTVADFPGFELRIDTLWP